MKKYINISYLLASLFVLLTACSEEIFSPNTLGDNVTLSLSYSDVSPKEITVNTRATDAEERHLNNLYIYIFDANGKLKGFKGIEGEDNLNQNTSSSTKADVKEGIKTRSGESYIYAVANVNTGLYPVTTSTGTIESGKLPIGLNEETAQAGGYDFTLDQLKSLTFYRNNPSIIHISSAFLMSGAVKNGNLVNITEDGKIAGDDDAIKLSRIVSKIKFTIKAATGDSRKFKLSNYTIMEISRVGSLIGTEDGNKKVSSSSSSDYSNTTASIGVNDVDANGAEFFEFYLPENLQDAKNEVYSWHEREADGQSISKTFTNAPDYGTYVVLKGKYEETKNGITRNADVTYYVHLGDCTEHINDYNVERNCKYTFNILVTGVDNIVVEACKESNEQPGAEGVVLEYGTAGKNMILDSHYEYMVMRFYQREIQDLKANGHGYYYQIKDIDGKTDPMDVLGDKTIGETNGANTDWVEFAIGGTYGDANNGRGVACAYPGWQNGKRNKNLYGIEDFLKMLYNNADNDSFWSNGSIDATCFISENYYAKKTWDQYVNKVPMRTVYVANEVYESKDKRSIYAKAAYGIQQHNIQTFYDRNQAGSIVAYGCETINDEEGLNYTVNGSGWTFESQGEDHWNGRSNMIQDVSVGSKWSSLNLGKDKSLIKACMSRNRDLNGDGIIDKEEVRWYAPAIDQYAGLWIGEQILNTEAKLYNQSTSSLKYGDEKTGRMLYYTSTSGVNTFFSEEGMATNDYYRQNINNYPPAYVRCVRNLKSNDIGYAENPDKYYTYNTTSKLMKLDKVDTDALDPSGEQGELNEHNERSDGNKPAKAFYVATDPYRGNNDITQQKVVEGTAKCNGKYNEDGKTWRVPNQREMSLMYLVSPDLIIGTYCRTKFSNFAFRKSWTHDGGNFTMNSRWGTVGSIRCISVTK